jgi:hypothetical protein
MKFYLNVIYIKAVNILNTLFYSFKKSLLFKNYFYFNLYFFKNYFFKGGDYK